MTSARANTCARHMRSLASLLRPEPELQGRPDTVLGAGRAERHLLTGHRRERLGSLRVNLDGSAKQA